MRRVILKNLLQDHELQARIEAFARRERARALKRLLERARQALRG